jgi:PAS domain S-box-containing protein
MDSKKTQDTKFQSFLESVPDAIVIVDKQGNIQSVNKQTEEMFGYDRNEIIGNKIELLIPSRFKEAHLDHRDDFVSHPKTRKMGEGMQLFAQRKNGNEFPVEISLSKIKTEEDFMVCSSIRDVSYQKRIEKELTEAIKNAENAVKSKQQFLSNMSHEIRTPMNAIIGFTKVMLKTDLTTKQKEYLSAIKISGDTLIVLINDILDLAKVDAGKMVFEKTPFKLSLSISTMLHLFEAKIQEKNLELILKYDENIPEVLLGDSARLHQIILNLISNAVKFTSDGKITVTVQKLTEDNDNLTIEFSIADTGIGIEENKINKIFENFKQASSTTSRLYGGTGLGLAIVKQLVEKQGGSIRVESEVDKGATFSFVLGFKKAKGEIVLDTEITDLVDNPIKDIKVLAVEDVELNQLLIKTLLDDFGFECEIADNGKIAIEKLEKNKYDIILMDLQMPVMNGFQATDYIRNTLKSPIPIIALTADINTEDIEHCMTIGMNDYIAKPVNERVLYNKIIGLIKSNIPTIESEITLDFESQTQKISDLNYLNKITKSNPKLMIEMIEVYLKQTPPLLTIIEDSLKNIDGQSLKMAIHKLIPSFTIMGIHPEIENMAKEIQENAHTISTAEETHKKTLHLINVCAQTCKELEQELINLKK